MREHNIEVGTVCKLLCGGTTPLITSGIVEVLSILTPSNTEHLSPDFKTAVGVWGDLRPLPNWEDKQWVSFMYEDGSIEYLPLVEFINHISY